MFDSTDPFESQETMFSSEPRSSQDSPNMSTINSNSDVFETPRQSSGQEFTFRSSSEEEDSRQQRLIQSAQHQPRIPLGDVTNLRNSVESEQESSR